MGNGQLAPLLKPVVYLSLHRLDTLPAPIQNREIVLESVHAVGHMIIVCVGDGHAGRR